MRVCTRAECQHEGKPQLNSSFNKRKGGRDGLSSWCRDCEREARAAKTTGSLHFSPEIAKLTTNGFAA